MSAESLQRPETAPSWFDGRRINETDYCQAFIRDHRIACADQAFFSPEGRLTDEHALRTEILGQISPYVSANVTRKIDSIMSLLRLMAHSDGVAPQADRLHLANGTLFLDGGFTESKDEIVRCRLPVAYRPDAPAPERWLRFLSELLYEEDIPTLQEFIGYCLIPTNAGQRMMVLKGSGGEGKSQVGAVLSALFGDYAKDGSLGKISENPFARADLEHCLLMIDDDMRLEALRQTNYIKSIVTCQGRMDLERKGKQSYQGWMYARILAFSNGDLTALYDHSEGFFRRQLILTARPRPADRVDDPALAARLRGELEGILLWALEGLRRLRERHYRFAESPRTLQNRETARHDVNNLPLFMASDGYIRRGADLTISSEELGRVYRLWCEENAYPAEKAQNLVAFLRANRDRYGLKYTHHLLNSAGRQVRGFIGMTSVFDPASVADVLPDA